MKLKYFIISLMFLSPSIVLAAADVCAVGFGDADTNGTYSDIGTANGYTLYSNGNQFLCVRTTDVTYWSFWDSSSCAPGGTTLWYYADDNTAYSSPDQVPAWVANSGDAPPGMVTDCSVPPPTPGYGGLQGLVDTATAGFGSTTGLSIASVVQWTGDNVISLFVGSGFSVLYELRYWIMVLLVIGAVIFFAFRGYQFFRN